MFSINSFTFMEYFLPLIGKNTDQQGNTEIKYIYSNIMNTFLKEWEGEARLQRTCLQGGRHIYGGGGSSTGGGGLVYRER
jgi:hypothetical protein